MLVTVCLSQLIVVCWLFCVNCQTQRQRTIRLSMIFDAVDNVYGPVFTLSPSMLEPYQQTELTTNSLTHNITKMKHYFMKM